MYRDQFGEFVCVCWGLKGKAQWLRVHTCNFGSGFPGSSQFVWRREGNYLQCFFYMSVIFEGTIEKLLIIHKLWQGDKGN